MSIGVPDAQQDNIIATDFFLHGSASSETKKTVILDEAKHSKDPRIPLEIFAKIIA